MAIRWAVANGNWSNVATWDGGVVLPGVGDTVHADGKTVTIDQNIIVESIRTTQRSGGLNGGGFLLAVNYNITAKIVSGGGIALTISTNGGSSNLVGNVSQIANFRAISKTGTSTLNIVGNINGASGYFITSVCEISAVCVVNITGNVYGNTDCYNNQTILVTANATLNITGNVYGSSSMYQNKTISVPGGCILNITGNVYGGYSIKDNDFNFWNTAVSSVSSDLSITGNVISSSSNPAVSNHGINARNLVNGNFMCVNGIMPIFCVKLILGITATTFTFQTSTNLDKYLYTAETLPGNPAEKDVRSNVFFGPNNDLVGTCHVPPKPSTVAGVPCDDGVGTFGFIPELITRLSNCATVESVGEQLEALM